MDYFGATFGKFGLLLFQHLVTLAAVDRDLLNREQKSLRFKIWRRKAFDISVGPIINRSMAWSRAV